MEECAYITEYFALVNERWHQISAYFIFVRLSLYVKPVVIYYYQYLSHDM